MSESTNDNGTDIVTPTTSNTTSGGGSGAGNDDDQRDDLNDVDENLDLENFGKKKKKKKKPFNLDEIESSLPSVNDTADDNIILDGTQDITELHGDEEFDLDLDFSKTKKKKKKKKDLDELVADKLDDDKSDDKENGKYL